jgi:hypothetical protein
MIQYYRENSSRSRENKRLCKATPVLGCSPVELGFDSPNAQATVFQRLLALVGTGAGIFPPGGNIYAGAVNPPTFGRSPPITIRPSSARSCWARSKCRTISAA